MKEKIKKAYYLWFTKVIFLLSIIFIFNRMNGLTVPSIGSLGLKKTVLYLFIAFPIYYLSVVINARAWVSAVRFLTQTKDPSDLGIAIYLKSTIAKYIPGNLLEYISRNLLSKKYLWDQKAVAMSALYEAIYLFFYIIVYLVFASKLLQLDMQPFFTASIEGFPMQTVLVLFVVIVVALQIPILIKKPNNIKKLFTIAFLKVNFWYAVASLFQLMSMAILIFLPLLWMNSESTITDATKNLVHLVTSYFTSYLTTGSPANMSQNQSAFFLGFSDAFKQSSLIIALTFYQIISIAGDVVCFLAGHYMETHIQQEKNQNAI